MLTAWAGTEPLTLGLVDAHSPHVARVTANRILHSDQETKPIQDRALAHIYSVFKVSIAAVTVPKRRRARLELEWSMWNELGGWLGVSGVKARRPTAAH